MKINHLATVLKMSGMTVERVCDNFAGQVRNAFEKTVQEQTNPKFRALGEKELARMDAYIAKVKEVPAAPTPAPTDAGQPDPKAE